VKIALIFRNYGNHRRQYSQLAPVDSARFLFRANNASSFVIPSFGVAKDKTIVYGVATVSRIDKITRLFCRISSLLQGSFAKETYDLIDLTDRSHPIPAVQLYLLHIICQLLPLSQGQGEMGCLCQRNLFYAELIMTHFKKRNIDRKIENSKILLFKRSK